MESIWVKNACPNHISQCKSILSSLSAYIFLCLLSGVIENMSYLECPDCGKKIPIFGESHLEEFSKQIGFDILGRLPLVSANAELVDQGKIEQVSLKEFEPIVDKIIGGK